MVRTQPHFTMSSTSGVQLHVWALYAGHRQVVLKLIKELYKMHVGCPGGERDRLTTVGGMALNLWRGININTAVLTVLFPTCF